MRELLDCHDQLEVAREAEEEYERRLDEEEAKGRRRVHALEVSSCTNTLLASSFTALAQRSTYNPITRRRCPWHRRQPQPCSRGRETTFTLWCRHSTFNVSGGKITHNVPELWQTRLPGEGTIVTAVPCSH